MTAPPLTRTEALGVLARWDLDEEHAGALLAAADEGKGPSVDGYHLTRLGEDAYRIAWAAPPGWIPATAANQAAIAGLYLLALTVTVVFIILPAYHVISPPAWVGDIMPLLLTAAAAATLWQVHRPPGPARPARRPGRRARPDG